MAQVSDPVVLHAKFPDAWNIGPHIRKCTECGVRLWLATDGEWTEDPATWREPPSGYVRCIDMHKERSV
jgi:hypothetical protein